MAYRVGLLNFSKGILSDELLGRVDVAAYSAGLKRAENVVILKYGGVSRRPGTEIVAEVRDAAYPVRLIPFQFSIEQAYALELGQNYMRPAAGGGMVTETAQAITGSTQANPVVLTVAAHGWSANDDIFISWPAQSGLDGGIFRASAVTTNTVTIPVNGTAFPAFAAGGTAARLYKVASPYPGSVLAEIDFEQSADVMYLAHLLHAPQKLQRFALTNWAFATITFGPVIAAPMGVTAVATTPNVDAENDGNAYFPQPATYVVTAVNDTTGQESIASTGDTADNDLTLKRNYNTITWTASANATRYRVYKSDNTQDYGYIGTTTELTFRDDNIAADLTDGPVLEVANPFVGAGNYPSTVTFFEQRLMWARTTNIPNGVWGAKSADFENMNASRPLKDDDAMSFKAVAGRVNAVNQLVSLSDLLLLTSDSLFKVNGAGSGDNYLKAGQIVARRQSGRGSSRLGPLVIDEITFYKPSVGNSVRTIGYTFETDGYKSNNVSIFSPSLFEGFDIVSWAYIQEPLSIIVAVRSDGKLLCFTWEQEQQVWGWTIWETDGLAESVCAVSEGGEDRLYLTVRRTIGGVARLFIERMASSRWSAIGDTCFLDCARRYDFAAPSAVLTNLRHLEGRSVTALVDGNVVSEDLVVANGQVTLPFAGRKIVCGLPYTATVETLPLTFQTKEGGSNQGKRSMTGKAVLRLVRSRGVKVGPTEEKLFPLKPRSGEPYGAPNDLLNGDYELALAPVVSGKASIVVQQSDPLPLTLTAAFLDPVVTE